MFSNLTIDSGTLSPKYSSGTTSCTDTAANSVSSVTVTPTADQANATIEVKGTAVASGSASSPLTLNVGSNPVSTVVTDQDGTTTDTYTITVTKVPNTTKKITAFISPTITNTNINESSHKIGLTVPYETNVTTLVATFTTTGNSAAVGATMQTSGTTTNDFTNSVIYAATAVDSSTQTNVVTVTSAANLVKVIAAFNFNALGPTVTETQGWIHSRKTRSGKNWLVWADDDELERLE
jgi:hypothetical protein